MQPHIVAGDWGHAYRIETFTVPRHSRSDFLSRVRTEAALLTSMPGFVQHLLFEQAGTTRDQLSIVTMAIWETPDALAAARRSLADRSAEGGGWLGLGIQTGDYARADA